MAKLELRTGTYILRISIGMTVIRATAMRTICLLVCTGYVTKVIVVGMRIAMCIWRDAIISIVGGIVSCNGILGDRITVCLCILSRRRWREVVTRWVRLLVWISGPLRRQVPMLS